MIFEVYEIKKIYKNNSKLRFYTCIIVSRAYCSILYKTPFKTCLNYILSHWQLGLSAFFWLYVLDFGADYV